MSLTDENIEHIAESFCKTLNTSDKEIIVSEMNNAPHRMRGSIAQYIRNKYKLWDREWKPEIIDGVDHSPNHPENVSDKIVDRIMEKLNEVGSS